MRRRPVDFRRPVRRRISSVVWWTLCGISVLLFIVIFSKESGIESRSTSFNKVKICALLFILLFWVVVNVFGCWKCRNFEGNQCFEFWDSYDLGFEDIIILIGFWLVLLMGLMKIEIYNYGVVAVLWRDC